MPILHSLVVKLGIDAKGLEQGIQKSSRIINKELSKVQREIGGFNRLGGVLKGVGTQLTAGLTLPLAGLGIVATKAFADFDSAMTQSLAIMGDVSSALKTEMSDAAREMAKTTIFSAKEAADSYFFLASAGLDATASIEALPKVAAFAQAGMFDMALATDLLTDAQSALGLTIRDDAIANMENMARVGDVLVKANTLANASVQQFSEALTNKAGPAMRAVGIEIEEGVAVLAAFADQGIKGAEAGTRFGIVLRDLQTKAIKNKGAFAELGISVFDANGEMNNIADVVGDLEGALSGMSAEQKKATLLMLGFSDKSVSALQALIGTSDAIRTYEKGLRDAAGTMDEVASKQLESFSAQMNLLKSEIVDAAIELGGALVPTLRLLTEAAGPAIDKIVAMVKWFGNLPGPVQTTAIALAAVVAAIGPLLFISGQLIQSMILVKAAFAGVGILNFSTGLKAMAALIRTSVIPVLGALGFAALAAGAAFAGFKLAEWLRQFSTESRGAEAALAELAAGLRAQGVELERGNKSLEEWAAVVFAAAEEAEKFAGSTEGLKKAFKAATKEFEKQRKAIVRGQKNVVAFTKAEVKLTKADKAYRASLKSTGTGLERVQTAVKDATRAQALAQEQLDFTTRAMDLGWKSAQDLAEAEDNLSAATDEVATAQADLLEVAEFLGIELDGSTTPAVEGVGDAAAETAIDIRFLAEAMATAAPSIRDFNAGLERLAREQGNASQRLLEVFSNDLPPAINATTRELSIMGTLAEEAFDKATESGRQFGEGAIETASEVGTQWKNTMQSVSTSITNAAQSMVGILIGVEQGSVGDAFKKLGQGVLATFVEPAIAAFSQLINEGIKEAIKWLVGEGGLLGALGKVGKAIGGIFGGGASGAASGAAGAAGSAASGAGGAASGAASGGASGVLGAIGVGAGVASAISGIIGNFQMARQETTLNAIEGNTRRSMLFLGDRSDGGILGTQFRILDALLFGTAVKAVEQLRDMVSSAGLNFFNASFDTMKGQLGFLNASMDTVKVHLSNIQGILEQYTGFVPAFATASLTPALSGPRPFETVITPGDIPKFIPPHVDPFAPQTSGINLTFTGNTISNREDMELMAEIVMEKLENELSGTTKL